MFDDSDFQGIFDHGTGILAFVALLVTFSHANSMVKKEVSKQRKRNLLYLSMIVINLAACVAFIYYIFNEMELYYAYDLNATSTLLEKKNAQFYVQFVKLILVYFFIGLLSSRLQRI